MAAQIDSSLYQCAYCGLPDARTDDHIPPKSLFKGLKNVQLVTVKACAGCHNKSTSLDDEYFVHVLLKYHRISDLPQAQRPIERMLRAAAKGEKRGYLEATVRSFVDVETRTFGGIFLGKKPAFRINRERLIHSSKRYIKGLYRHKFGKSVPSDSEIHIVLNPEGIWREKQKIILVFPEEKMKVVHPDVFKYSCVVPVDNPSASYWFLLFFNQFPIIGYIRQKQIMNERP